MAHNDGRIFPLLALCLGALACSESGDSDQDAAICELAGDYDVTLTVLTGNCGAQPPSTLTIPEAQIATPTETRTVGDGEVDTMILRIGCSVRLRQELASIHGARIWQLDAESLQLVSEGTLEGQAEFTRFQDDALICEGTYEMTLHRAP
jgi:hypothetical protein